MSKERQRRRAAQAAARSKPGARASRSGAAPSAARPGAGASGSPATSRKVRGSAGPARSGSAGRPGAKRGGKPTVYRQRRFKPLPTKLKAALAVGWLVVAVLVLVFVPTWTARIGLLVIATMLLPLIVVLVRDPSRRTR